MPQRHRGRRGFSTELTGWTGWGKSLPICDGREADPLYHLSTDSRKGLATFFHKINLPDETGFELVVHRVGMTNLLSAAVRGSAETLYITFASGYQKSALGIPNIPVVADDINSRLTNYFNAHDKGRYRIVLMDFVDAHHCSQIISTDSEPISK